jgi:uncharacterized protein (TIGR02246 family)
MFFFGCAATGRQAMMPHDTSTDEAAILNLHESFADAWSRGDANALVAFFTADAVRVGAAGDTQRGHEEIRGAFERLLFGPFAGASVKLDRGSVRFLGFDVALWQGGLEIMPGGDRPPLRGYSVDVMKKVGASWLILETHPKLFPVSRRFLTSWVSSIPGSICSKMRWSQVFSEDTPAS